MTGTKVQVTQEDITEGVAGNCGRCPVALALNRTLGLEGNNRMYVLKTWFKVYETSDSSKLLMMHKLPSSVREFINEFDDGYKRKAEFEPFEFEIGEDMLVNQ